MNTSNNTCVSCGSPLPVTPEGMPKNTTCLKCRMSSFTKNLDAKKAESKKQENNPSNTEETPISQPKVSVTPKELPERMKASKALSGQTCNVCNNAIELGDDIHNCQTCRASTVHLACHESIGKCSNSGCASNIAKNTQGMGGLKKDSPNLENNSTEEDMVDCKFCGEKIKRKAVRCPYCRENLKPSIESASGKKRTSYDEDDNLSTTEIVLSVLCSGIACIVGIVYIIQGKKKGWKMFGISMAVQVIIGIIRVSLKI